MNTITTAFGGLGNFGTYLNCIPALEVILLGWGDVIQVKLKELVITNFVPLVMQSSTPSTHQHTPTQHARPSTPTPTPHTHIHHKQHFSIAVCGITKRICTMFKLKSLEYGECCCVLCCMVMHAVACLPCVVCGVR